MHLSIKQIFDAAAKGELEVLREAEKNYNLAKLRHSYSGKNTAYSWSSSSASLLKVAVNYEQPEAVKFLFEKFKDNESEIQEAIQESLFIENKTLTDFFYEKREEVKNFPYDSYLSEAIKSANLDKIKELITYTDRSMNYIYDVLSIKDHKKRIEILNLLEKRGLIRYNDNILDSIVSTAVQDKDEFLFDFLRDEEINLDPSFLFISEKYLEYRRRSDFDERIDVLRKYPYLIKGNEKMLRLAALARDYEALKILYDLGAYSQKRASLWRSIINKELPISAGFEKVDLVSDLISEVKYYLSAELNGKIYRAAETRETIRDMLAYFRDPNFSNVKTIERAIREIKSLQEEPDYFKDFFDEVLSELRKCKQLLSHKKKKRTL